MMPKTVTVLLDSVILDWNPNILLFPSVMRIQSFLHLFTKMKRNQAKAAAVQKDEVMKSRLFKVKTQVVHGRF